MENAYIALVTLTYWDEVDNVSRTNHLIFTEVNNYEDTLERIKAYYGDTIEKLTIELLEGPLFVTEGILDNVRKDVYNNMNNGEA